MRIHALLPLPFLLASSLWAQTPPTAPAPPAPAAPAPPAPGTIKWRGAFWASAAASDTSTADGSLFLRGTDAGNDQLAVDGLQVGADVTLYDGWSLRFTFLGGQDGRAINLATLGANGQPTDAGSIAYPEAQLIWTGGDDTLKLGRMYTPMGMEVVDGTQNATASRGLLFTYAVPFGQVGVNWHHAFSPAWSSDVWVYNGEDRLQDNNQGKSGGLGLTYNHAGAADKFVTLMVFSGPEQTSLGGAAIPGAEGRKRNRVSLAGQWTWGSATLQFEGERASEAMPAGAPKANWSGAGLIFKYQLSDPWAVFLRAETLQDDTGMRLAGDSTIAAARFPASPKPDLTAVSAALGVERKWHATFTRLELRQDSLNKNVNDADGKPFKSAVSATWSVGTSF